MIYASLPSSTSLVSRTHINHSVEELKSSSNSLHHDCNVDFIKQFLSVPLFAENKLSFILRILGLLYATLQCSLGISAILENQPCIFLLQCACIVRLNSINVSFIVQVLAHLLDMVFYSDEKERVIPLLVNIMHYVVPYLRNHR